MFFTNTFAIFFTKKNFMLRSIIQKKKESWYCQLQ